MKKRILNLLHIHWFSKPIASQYVSFHQRNIIYECRCGKRKMALQYIAFDEPLPIETNSLISNDEMQKILSGEITLTEK